MSPPRSAVSPAERPAAPRGRVRSSRGDRVLDRTSTAMMLVASFALAAGVASWWRWLVATDERPLLSSSIAGVTSVAAAVVLVCAVAAQRAGLVGTGPRDVDSYSSGGWWQVLPALLWVLAPWPAFAVMWGRHGDDAALVPVLVAALAAGALPLVERPRLGTTATVGWLALLCSAWWVPPPWPELGFAALAVVCSAEVARVYFIASHAGRRRWRGVRTAAQVAVLAVLSVLLLIAVPPPPGPPVPPGRRAVALPYLTPAWNPVLEVRERDRRDWTSEDLSGGRSRNGVLGSWVTGAHVARPPGPRGTVSAQIAVAVVTPEIATDAVRHAVEGYGTSAGDVVVVLPDLPAGWNGRVVTGGTTQTVTAAGRVDNVVVSVGSRQGAPVIDAAADVRDLARRIAARGVVAFAADTDPLR